MPPKKTPFNRSHEAEYGLEATEFGETRAVVKTVECLFCRYYGRVEGAENGKIGIPLF